MDGNDKSSFTLQMIEKALALPGVKIDRRKFLSDTFGKSLSNEDLLKLLDLGPSKSGLINRKDLKKAAIKSCNSNKWSCSATSFASGFPGGIAVAATIPLDTIQFFGFSLRIAQQVAYIYGYEDFWNGDILNNEKVESELVMFLGVMMGVGGASHATRLFASQFAKKIASDLPKKALTKTIYYPIIKSIAKSIGIKVTKESFAKSLSKAIPVLGGIISGGMTYSSMSIMNKRLYETFEATLDYNEDRANEDLESLKEVLPEIFDVDRDDYREL